MSKVVYFLDIDDCLIHTSKLRPVHLAAVKKYLEKLKTGKAAEITAEFSSTFTILFDRHQGKPLTINEEKILEDFTKRMEKVEKPIIEKYSKVKKWSREVYVYLAAQKYAINLSNEDLMYITDNLWSKLSQTGDFYPDALPFLRSLQRRKIHFYLITSSDCRLILDDKTGLFHYDPDYSKRLKFTRLAKFVKLGILPENIFIADPYDKPDPWIFRQALSKAKKDLKSRFTSIMIGDSPKNDLYPAKKAGIEILYWLKRDAAKERAGKDNKITVIKSLTSQIKDKDGPKQQGLKIPLPTSPDAHPQKDKSS